LGVSEATIYTWKSKYGGMEVSEARRLKPWGTLKTGQ
jgi:putative transposase